MYTILLKMANGLDGYLNSKHVINKIKDELYIRGGRLRTEDLAQELNVDLEQLNQIVSKIVKGMEVQLVEGVLIAHYYIEEIARQINVKLQRQGQISVDELVLQFDLPAAVLQCAVLKKYMGTIISGRQDTCDPKIFYTEEYFRRSKAKLRGALMGLLEPTLVTTIMENFNLAEGLFFELFDQLNDTGDIVEYKYICWTWYAPPCYLKSKKDWILGGYEVDNYLTYSSLTYCDISNEQEYVKQILPNEDMIFLKGCALNIQLKHKLEDALQKCIASKSYLKVQSFLNFELYDEDIETFLLPMLKNYHSSTILFDKTVFSNQFIETLKQICIPIMQKNAELLVISGKYQQYVQVVQDSDSDGAPCLENTSSCLEIISIEDVENTIKKTLENEGLDDFVTQIARHIQGYLNKTALEFAKEFSKKLFEHNMEQFYQAVNVCLSECGMIFNKNNKKKNRILLKMANGLYEYLNLQHVINKIKDELYIRGGRVRTEDLAQELNVDLEQLNLIVSKIVNAMEVQLAEGVLIAHYYIEEIARQINVKLQRQGQISVDDLIQQFDLPEAVLQRAVLKKYMGTIISGRQGTCDPKIFYTEEYFRRSKAKLRGALMGLLKPTLVTTIMEHFNLTEGLFFDLFDQLNDTGVITESQNICWVSYVPHRYIKSKNDLLIGCYKVNNYLMYSTLTYCYISNEKEYVKQILPNEDMIFLKGCVINIQLKHKLENALQECIASKSYLKVQSFLNFKLYDEDIETFLVPLLKNYHSSTILFDKTVFSNQFIETLKQICLPIIQKHAKLLAISCKYQQFLKKQQAKSAGLYTLVDHNAEKYEEHKKKAKSSNESGNTHGRDTKSKDLKKHSKTMQVVQDSDSDEEPCLENTSSGLEIISIEDVENTIKKTLENEGLDNFVTQIARHIQGYLNETALEIAKEFFKKLFEDAQNREFTHYSAQNRINMLINHINLYEKGLKLLPSDQQPQFIKYLLESFGGNVLSEFCKHVANQCNLPIQAGVLSVEQRNKIMNDLSEEYIQPLCALNTVLAEHNMEQFYQAVNVCSSEFGMIFNKNNKKKDRLLVHKHKEKLLSDIKNCEEPALVLCLVVLVLFTIVTQNILHASGRQVPLIILFLKSKLKDEHFDKIQKYHEIVTKYLTAADEEKESINKKLKEDLSSLKSLVTDVKIN